MKPATTRRLIKEYSVWLKEPIPGVFLKPDPNDILTWKGVFEGPIGTPYEKGVYQFEIKFPSDYPFKMYKITVNTKIHHINFDKNGRAWLLDPDQWSPALTASRGLQTLMNFVSEPDDNFAMSQDVYDEWADNRAAFNEKARAMRDQYASGYISDYHYMHDDPDWASNYVTSTPAAPSTSAPTQQPATPSFSFGSPSTASITPTTQASDVISVNTAAQKQLDDMKTRLRSEYQDLLAHPVKHAVAAPSPENPLIWTGIIDELYGTPYENDLFKFEIVFSSKNTEPLIRVTSPIKHSIIKTDTPIRLSSILTGGWNASSTVSDLLRGLVTLMTEQRAS